MAEPEIYHSATEARIAMTENDWDAVHPKWSDEANGFVLVPVESEECPHDSGVERLGDLLQWACRECGEIAPWSADVRLGRDTREP